MKKLIAFVLAFIFVQSLVGCQPDGATVNPPNVPPHILSFDSFEGIGELKSMLEKDDTTVDEYLKSKHYHMNGLTSKEDIDRLFDDIGDLRMLHIAPASGYVLGGITYYPSYHYIASIYKNGTDTVRLISYIEGSTDELKTEAVGSISIEKETVELHRLKNSHYVLAGNIQTANSHITIQFSEDDIDTIQSTISENIISSTLLDFIEK